MKLSRKFGLALAFAAAAGLGGAAAALAAEPELTEIKIGLVGEHDIEWDYVAEQVLKEGIKLTRVTFADYTLPNRVLAEGELDLNAFQHVAFFNEDVKAHGYKLSIIGNTIIAPLSVYSDKIGSLDELKEGDIIAIPNDVTNGGRALKVLELAGVIKLDPAKGYVPEVGDIIENPKKLRIYEVDAGNTPSLIPDVAAAIINSNFAIDNGLDPNTDAIFSDGVGRIDEHNPFINIIVSRTEDVDRPEFKTILRAYNSREVAEIIKKRTNGVSIPVFEFAE